MNWLKINSTLKDKENASYKSEKAVENTVEGVILSEHEINEILFSPPVWILRWGISIISAILMTCLLIVNFINYPEVISSKALLLNSNFEVHQQIGIKLTIPSRYSKKIKIGQKIKIKCDDYPYVESECISGVIKNYVTSEGNVCNIYIQPTTLNGNKSLYKENRAVFVEIKINEVPLLDRILIKEGSIVN